MCPEEIVVLTSFDGVDADMVFDRRRSLLGQGYAYALCHYLQILRPTAPPCGGLCAAETLASTARERFLAAGCSADDVDGRFDVAQVGAHVGASRNYRDELIDPVHEWLADAPGYRSALLVEPIRSSFEALVATRAAHG